MKKILFGMVIGIALYSYMPHLFASEPVYKYYNVTVASGDTLWSIAARNSGANADIQEEIFKICKANELKNKEIYPGQVLRIPVKVEAKDYMLAKK